MKEFAITTTKTARYCMLGEPDENTREVWIVLHGYGQLASFFLRQFEAISEPGVVVVAPEALSRFYLNGTSGRVGATWMTKEARLSEISDYVQYLSNVFDAVCEQVGHRSFRLNVLGFSQGAATACRWVTEAHPPVSTLICWAGFFPPDLHWHDRDNLENLPVYLVIGDKDEYATAEMRAQMNEIIVRLKFKPIIRTFEGRHEINTAALVELAAHLRQD